MIKTITRIGNSQGLIFDQSLMEMARLSTGDLVNITVARSGVIVLTPARSTVPVEDVKERARSIIRKHDGLFRRLV
jgi:antitoxin component of MazEF toxin-antitoxin module